MIYVTVGTQLPFDRLVRAVDRWASRHGQTEVFAQIGRSSFEPSAMQWDRFLSPEESVRYLDQADIVVSHAGTGTIIGALERGKPIIVMPRRQGLGEHRTDHQVATAKRFGERGLVCVAEDETLLAALLDAPQKVRAAQRILKSCDRQLLQFLAAELDTVQ